MSLKKCSMSPEGGFPRLSKYSIPSAFIQTATQCNPGPENTLNKIIGKSRELEKVGNWKKSGIGKSLELEKVWNCEFELEKYIPESTFVLMIIKRFLLIICGIVSDA